MFHMAGAAKGLMPRSAATYALPRQAPWPSQRLAAIRANSVARWFTTVERLRPLRHGSPPDNARPTWRGPAVIFHKRQRAACLPLGVLLPI